MNSSSENAKAVPPSVFSGEARAQGGPRDVFIHLLAMITLYISAVSFGSLLFQYINRWFPDPLVDQYAYASGSIRWALASLVIVFPVYVWVSRLLAREMLEHTEKRELRIRRWLLYFTLFAAAVVIIGDLVALVYNFLGGDLSTRFVLKILAVLSIAAAVFVYYLWNLRHEAMASKDERMRFFVWAAVAIVVAATIGGFFLVGSPFRERLRRFDERRVQDLQTIQWQVVNFWQKKNKLPGSLDDLRDPISGFILPQDPETGDRYEYHALAPLKFELCATFKTDSAETQSSSPSLYRAPMPAGVEMTSRGKSIGDTWDHRALRACFERSIDPDLYRLPKGG